MKISVFGAGYVGLVTGTCLAEIGHEVSIFDIDSTKLKLLQKGEVPIHEPGLEKIFKKNLNSNGISIQPNPLRALDFSDAYFVCVGTPQFNNGKPNLKYLYSVCRSIKKYIIKNDIQKNKFIVLKSTIPPGTIADINSNIFSDDSFSNIHIGSNPEFLREGNAVFDFMNSDRIVIGSDSKRFINKIKKIYEPFKKSTNILVTDPQSSEIIKYASNAFLATKISFINEISKLSDKVGGDIDDISYGMGLDKRIGNLFLSAGLGYGGSCFPKDTRGLAYTFSKNNIRNEIIESVIKVNDLQKDYFINKIFKRFSKKDLINKSVLVLGTAFKPNTDDIRESVGLELIKKISPLVKKVSVFEPVARKNSIKELSNLINVSFQNTKEPRISNEYDFLIISTEYPEFANISVNKLLNLKDKLIFDGRNILNKNKLLSAGIEYYGIGK